MPQSSRLRHLAAGLLAVAITAAGWSLARADTAVMTAVSSGERALDSGEGGGNPFASALIEVLARSQLQLGELPAALKHITHEKSRGRMTADVPPAIEPHNWSVAPARPDERRLALVLIVSDYSRTGGAKSLPGAKLDAGRIASALRAAGFSTEVALDLDQEEMRQKLATFGAASRRADAAVIYTTGHGVEVDGRIYLIPSDYPIKERNAALASRAIPLASIASPLQARNVNLVFYGGCRDNPFGAKN